MNITITTSFQRGAPDRERGMWLHTDRPLPEVVRISMSLDKPIVWDGPSVTYFVPMPDQQKLEGYADNLKRRATALCAAFNRDLMSALLQNSDQE